MIKDTLVSKTGSLIVKCHNNDDFDKVESALRKNINILKIATIKKAGPKEIRFVIKNIPYQTDEKIIIDSLTKQFGANNFKMEKYFVYKKSEAYTQVVSAREDLVAPLLTSSSPRLQLGNCFYNIDIYIPTIRCFKCQEYGHTFNQCKQKDSYCAICAHPGHSSNECQIRLSDFKKLNCINCLTHNGNIQGNDQQQYFDTNHTAFSNRCQVFKIFFNETYKEGLAKLNVSHSPAPPPPTTATTF